MSQVARKTFFKGIELLITQEQLKAFEKELSNPANHEFQVSLTRMIQTDSNGLITMLHVNSSITMGLYFMVHHIMVAQRMYLIDEFMRKNGVIDD